ncbi:hypothetical protein EHF32_15350 [Microbacterium sp. RG1]|nr:hypothetical protein EHF32_15350 [Microbacterium sp. RG1]
MKPRDLAESVRRRRMRTTLLISGLLFAVLCLGGGLAAYVFPTTDEPRPADLVFVLGPASDARIDEALALLSNGRARSVLISVASERGQSNYKASRMPICEAPNVECSKPTPLTTKGEARLLNRYASSHDIESVIVVTFTPHVSRARYIMERCAPDLDIEVVGVDEDLSLGDWAYQFAYQTGGFVKAMATPCSTAAH